MKDNSNHMDKAIKEKFEGHEVRVSSHLWNSIESKLPQQKKRFDLFSFFKNPFIISILLASIATSYIYLSKQEQNQHTSNVAAHSALEVDQTTATLYPDNDITSNTEETHTGSNSQTKTNNENTLSFNQKNSGTITSGTANTERTNGYNQADSRSFKNQSTQYIPNPASKKQIHEKQIRKANAAGNPDNTGNTGIKKLTPASTDNQFQVSKSIQTSTRTSQHIQTASGSYKTNVTSQKQQENINSISTYEATDITSAHFSQESDFTKTDQEVSRENTLKNTSEDLNIINNQTTEKTTSGHLQETLLTSAQNNSLSSNQNQKSSLLSGSESLNNQQYNSFVNTLNQTNTSNANTTEALSISTVADQTGTQHVYDKSSISYAADTSVSASAEKITTASLFSDSTAEVKAVDSTALNKTAETITVKSNEEQKKKSVFLSKCSIDGYVTPALAYMHTIPNSNDEKTNAFAADRNQDLKPGSGITAGLRMNYALSQKIEIGIGFQYAGMRQQSTLTHKTLDSTFVTYQGYTQVDSTYDTIKKAYTYKSQYILTDSTPHSVYSTHSQKYINKYQSFSVPIHIAYGYSVTDRFSLLARTSLIINYQTYSVTYVNESEESVRAYHSRKNLSLGGSFSIGGYYAFSRRYSAFIEPIVNYYFSNVFDNQTPFKQTQLMLGLQTGLRMSF